MAKRALSVTLDMDNVTWLKGRAAAGRLRGVSELLDQLVTQARASGPAGTVRSVVGTLDIDSTDPLLDRADQAVRSLFEMSLNRPLLLKERAAKYGRARTSRVKRRG